MKIAYLGFFLSDQAREALLAAYPAKHEVLYAHHLTIVFKPNEEQVRLFSPLVGTSGVVTVLSHAFDDKGQAVGCGVDGMLLAQFMSNRVPHVTISCAKDTAPVYSNKLLEKGATLIHPFTIDGVFDTYPRSKP